MYKLEMNTKSEKRTIKLDEFTVSKLMTKMRNKSKYEKQKICTHNGNFTTLPPIIVDEICSNLQIITHDFNDRFCDCVGTRLLDSNSIS